jgi:hypothetical protein
MNPEYTWLTLGKGTNNFMDIMAAPIHKPAVFLEEISKTFGWSEITLCIGGELKTSEEGRPASNFRHEKDEVINKNVIENYIQLFNLHREIYRSKPIFVTTIPRSWRTYSWLITKDGNIIRKDQEYRRRMDDETDPRYDARLLSSEEGAYDEIDKELKLFLSHNCIESDQLIKIRECCKGARYHTYLADMISFLYQLRCNQDEFSDTFYPEYREAVSRSHHDSMDTLSFEKSMDNGIVFLCPKRDSVESIYRDFSEAISLKENPTKAKIREHLKKSKINRWTDFSANDTDDAFTILMMIHAFNGLVGEKNEHGYGYGVYYSLSQEDKIILDSLHSSLDNWRSQLQ